MIVANVENDKILRHAIIRSVLLIIITLGPLIIADAENDTIPTTYITYVDSILGFYKVRDVTTPIHKFSYENRTLNINVGDTIIWENDAEKTTFIIVSGQGLWNDKVGYLRVGSKINYKFDTPGKYVFYIKEYSSRGQTVIVNGQTVIPTVTSTEVSTPTVTSTEVIVPTPTVTSTEVIVPNNTQIPNTMSSPIKLSPVAIASIIIAISSMIITFAIGRNKR